MIHCNKALFLQFSSFAEFFISCLLLSWSKDKEVSNNLLGVSSSKRDREGVLFTYSQQGNTYVERKYILNFAVVGADMYRLFVASFY